MTKQTYRLDVSKIKTIKNISSILDGMNLITYYDPEDPEDENYHLREYFTILQEPQGLTFSTPRRSIEEIQQEFDEKIDKLIEQTKRNFYASKLTAERNYEYKFDKISDNFEYAKKHGSFPSKLLFTVGDGLSVNASSYIQTAYVIKQENKHEGYYTIGNQRYFRYYMPNKPNMIVRFFMRTCLNFVWVDEK